MTFVHIGLLHLFSFLFFYIYINIVWRKNYSGLSGSMAFHALCSYNVLSTIWPDDPKFWSLKFSALRHTVIPLLLSTSVWFVNLKWLNTLCFLFSCLYASIGLNLYLSRRSDYKNALQRTHSYKFCLKPVKSACFWLLVHSYANFVIFIICYVIRP